MICSELKLVRWRFGMLFTARPFDGWLLARWWPKCKADGARWTIDGELGCCSAFTEGGGVCLSSEIELLGEYWSRLELDPFEQSADEWLAGKLVSHCMVDDWLFEIELLLMMEAGDGVENWRVDPFSGLPKSVWLNQKVNCFFFNWRILVMISHPLNFSWATYFNNGKPPWLNWHSPLPGFVLRYFARWFWRCKRVTRFC